MEKHNACEYCNTEPLSTVAMTTRLQPVRAIQIKEVGRFVVTDSHRNERFVFDNVLERLFDS